MWKRINKSIEDTGGKSARAWGSWLSFVGQDTEHPHRMGAELLGYSLNPVGTKNKKGQVKLYEWEHAMPATKAYLYLLKSAVSENFDFKSSYDLVTDNFKLIALDGAEDLKLKNSGRTTSMGAEWSILTDSWLDRYFHEDVVAVRGGIDPNSIIGFDGKTFGEIFNINAEGVDPAFESARDIEARDKDSKVMDQAFKASRSSTKPKGITVLDFDDTLATTKSNVLYTAPDGTTGTLNAEEFAKQGGDLLAQGVKFDFSEFNKVVKGETAPLFNKAMKLYGKFGAENMFILTARAPESQLAIKQFLDAQGLKIPLKNITGLGKSEASAKANWIAEKVGEGYNDFYFADDAIQNVDAVRDKLDELQVKNKVQQAKIKFSMNTKRDLNWKSTDRVTFNLEGNRVTEGKIYNASFKVGDNDYIIRLTNRPLSVNFDQGVVSGKSAFDLEFSLENQADELWDGAGKMGVEGTGRASEVLSIVSNGVMDFIKNNDVDAIGFSSADTSRTRLYNTLTKFWASRLGWEWTSQTFKPDKRTGEDFTGGKFIISNPNAIKPTVEPSTIEVENRAQEPKLKRNTPRPDIKRGVKFSKSKSTTPLDLYKPYSGSESDPYGVKLKSVPSNVLKSKGYKTFIKALQGELIHGSQVKASDLESNGSKRSLNWFTLSRNRAEGVEYAKFIEREFEGEEDNEVLVTNVSKFKNRILPDFEAIDIQTWDKKDTEKRNAVGKRLDKKYGEVPYQNKDIFNHPRASELIADLIDIIIEQNPSGNYALETFNGGLITQNYPVVVLGGIKPGDLKTAFTKDLGSGFSNRSTEEKNMLNMFDVKSKVQQARMDFLGDPREAELKKEASINDIKDTKKLANPDTYNNIKDSGIFII